MRVLALCSFPIEAAATRFRLAQFVEPLRRHGIELTISPFLDSEAFKDLYVPRNPLSKAAGLIPRLFDRFRTMATARSYDLLFVQREAMLFGPAIFEWLYAKLGHLPMVLDLDDATYIPYTSPTFGRLGSLLKFFGKTDNLIKRAAVVTCGNSIIAEHVEALGSRAVVIPTIVDLDVFKPLDPCEADGPVTLGWIGTHSTFPSIEWLLPVLEKLASDHNFRLKIVGSGQTHIQAGIDLELDSWSLEREIEDFRSLDIGLYPITTSSSADTEWIRAKSGFKAIQYLAVGIPFVMSPVGVCAEIGDPGVTHFNARSEADWYNHLQSLLLDKELRTKMGKAGRQYALANFALEMQVQKLANVFASVVETGRQS